MSNILNIIQYYCYPNNNIPSNIYLNMDEEFKSLLLKASAEFIVNVRLKNNHPIEKWSNHKDMWDSILKNSL